MLVKWQGSEFYLICKNCLLWLSCQWSIVFTIMYLSTFLLSLFSFLGKLNWDCKKHSVLFVLILLLVLEILENEQIMTNEFQKTFQESCVKCPSSGRFYHVSLTSTNKAWSKGFDWFRIHTGSMLLSSFLYVNTRILICRISLRMVWDEMVAEGFWVLKHSGMLPAT